MNFNSSTVSSEDGSQINSNINSKANKNEQSNNPGISSSSVEGIKETPNKVTLYKNGKSYDITNIVKTKQIIDTIASWFVGKDFLPATNLIVSDELISVIKNQETAVEMSFNETIIINGKHSLGDRVTKILIPISGRYSYYIFKSFGQTYNDGPNAPIGNGLDNIISNLSLN